MNPAGSMDEVYSLKERIILGLTTTLIILVTRLIGMTLRPRYIHRERYDAALDDPARSLLLPYWHEHIISAIYLFRHNGIVCMSSRSKDGELVTRVLRHFGYCPSRGSSHHGGKEAIGEMISEMQRGKRIGSLTVDGPRGPRRVMKDGILRIAHVVDSVVMPVGFSYEGVWRLSSWDRFCIPKPFTRVAVAFGNPLTLTGRGHDELARSLKEAQRSMDAVDREAGDIARTFRRRTQATQPGSSKDRH